MQGPDSLRLSQLMKYLAVNLRGNPARGRRARGTGATVSSQCSLPFPRTPQLPLPFPFPKPQLINVFLCKTVDLKFYLTNKQTVPFQSTLHPCQTVNVSTSGKWDCVCVCVSTQQASGWRAAGDGEDGTGSRAGTRISSLFFGLCLLATCLSFLARD